jgi:hypothetical protein
MTATDPHLSAARLSTNRRKPAEKVRSQSGFSAGCFPALLYHYHKNKRKYLLNNWPYYTIQKITTETAGGQTTREQGRRFQKKYEKHEMQPAVA